MAAALLGPAAGCAPEVPGPPAEALRERAFVWQRRWTPEVQAAVAGAADWDGLVVLVAEMDADGEVHGTEALGPAAASALAAGGAPVSLAVRVGGLPADGGARLLRLAAAAVAEARANGLAPASLHLDLDAPTARLGELVPLVAALKDRVAPLPVEVLSLPDWARAPELAALSAAADTLIVQVHGLEREHADAPPVVFDPALAARAAEAYAQLGRPFEVALPAHRWTLAAGEGWARAQADPAALAAQLQAWSADRPAGLGGLCWFRLPVAGDRGTWPDAALDRLRAGEVPQGAVAVQLVDEGAAGLLLVAQGEGDLPAPLPELRVSGPGLRPGDAWRGGRWSVDGEGIRWSPLVGDELWPGETARLGWVHAAGPATATPAPGSIGGTAAHPRPR